jgi:SDR family mycofactocin-dependent oxidoreductase
MGELDGKVAFVTGAGRGQGRASAVRLASLGADVIALDVAADPLETIPYTLATPDDLDETIALIEALDRRALRGVADVRSLAEVQAVVDAGLETFGHIDIVHANAGIGSWGVTWELSELEWREMVDTNLNGVFHTIRAALPSMVERGAGGNVILTSSTAGVIGYMNTAHYTAAKHGVLGLMKVLAQELGPHGIRINALCPTTVRTPLVINDATFELFAPDVENPGEDDVRAAFEGLNALSGLAWLEPEDVADAVAWLCSDAARYVHGVALPIDGGNLVRKGW